MQILKYSPKKYIFQIRSNITKLKNFGKQNRIKMFSRKIFFFSMLVAIKHFYHY